MITIIHGDDIVSSRKFLLEEKQKAKDFYEFEGETLNLIDLIQIFEGSGLFADSKTVFVENFFSKRKASKEKEAIASYISKNSSHAVYLWEGKEISVKSFSIFKKALIKPFKLPPSIFQFLDSLQPQKGQKLLFLFHKALETSEAETIFYMLTRRFRLLLALSDINNQSSIEEVKKLVPWQKEKLERQVKMFDKEELIIAYKKLFDIDLRQKTGSLSLSLVAAIDFFLLEL